MEISQNELVQALERAQEYGMSTAQSLADFVAGYHSLATLAREQEPQTQVLWPDTLRDAADVEGLEWPEGTRIEDADGDGYIMYKGAWLWDTWRNNGGVRLEPHEYDRHLNTTDGEGNLVTLLGTLPARVISIGKEDN